MQIWDKYRMNHGTVFSLTGVNPAGFTVTRRTEHKSVNAESPGRETCFEHESAG